MRAEVLISHLRVRVARARAIQARNGRLQALEAVARGVRIRFLGGGPIGGVTEQRIAVCREAGAGGYAAIGKVPVITLQGKARRSAGARDAVPPTSRSWASTQVRRRGDTGYDPPVRAAYEGATAESRRQRRDRALVGGGSIGILGTVRLGAGKLVFFLCRQLRASKHCRNPREPQTKASRAGAKPRSASASRSLIAASASPDLVPRFRPRPLRCALVPFWPGQQHAVAWFREIDGAPIAAAAVDHDLV